MKTKKGQEQRHDTIEKESLSSSLCQSHIVARFGWYSQRAKIYAIFRFFALLPFILRQNTIQ